MSAGPPLHLRCQPGRQHDFDVLCLCFCVHSTRSVLIVQARTPQVRDEFAQLTACSARAAQAHQVTMLQAKHGSGLFAELRPVLARSTHLALLPLRSLSRRRTIPVLATAVATTVPAPCMPITCTSSVPITQGHTWNIPPATKVVVAIVRQHLRAITLMLPRIGSTWQRTPVAAACLPACTAACIVACELLHKVNHASRLLPLLLPLLLLPLLSLPRGCILLMHSLAVGLGSCAFVPTLVAVLLRSR
jgi:hypothetical protein